MRNRRIWVAGGVLALVLCVIGPLVPYVATFGFDLSPEHQRWGEFGSFFGGLVGPFVAQLSLVGVVLAIWLQGEAIDIQRNAERDRTTKDMLVRLIDFKELALSRVVLLHDNGQDVGGRAIERALVMTGTPWDLFYRKNSTVLNSYVGAIRAIHDLHCASPPSVSGTSLLFIRALIPEYEVRLLDRLLSAGLEDRDERVRSFLSLVRLAS